jgi:hypothetical protein
MLHGRRIVRARSHARAPRIRARRAPVETGKPRGDTCIAKTEERHEPPGCAC